MTRALMVGALLAFLCAAVLIFAYCGTGEGSPETVHGRITDVQIRSVTEVDSFSLSDATGETWSFTADGPLEFTPSHLREHMLTGEDVSVRFRRAGDVLIAVSVEDYP